MLLFGQNGQSVAASTPVGESGEIALFFTDLTSGPNTGTGTYADGAFVRLYGAGFGATQGSGTVTLNGTEVASYESWGTDSISGLDMIIVQPGSSTSTGDFVVTNSSGQASNGIAFTVDNTRNIREVDGNTELVTAVNAINTTNASDIVYLRAGSYTTRVGTTSWGNDQFTFGPDWDDTAWIAYPGETVNTEDWRFNDGTGNCDNVTVSGLTATGGDDTFFSGIGGQSGTADEAGPVNQRIIGCDITTTYTGNTMTGAVQFSGDGGRMQGCYCHDNGGTTVFNNNHSVYIQVGADDCEVSYNRFYNERLGHVVQVHTDGPLRQYDNIRIHSNLFQLGPNGDCRGTNVSGTTASSTIDIYNNTFDQCGGAFSTHISYTGDTNFYHNTLVRCEGWPGDGLVRIVGGTCAVRNNILWEDGSANAYIQNPVSATVDSNCYFNAGNGPSGDTNAYNGDPDLVDTTNSDWSLRNYAPNTDSPIRDRGFGDVSDVTITYDRLGNARSSGVRADIGANETVRALRAVSTSATIDQDYDRITIPIANGEGADIGGEDFTIEAWINASTNNTDSGGAFFNGNIWFDKDHLGQNTSLVLSIHAGVPQIYMRESGSTSLQNASTDIRGDWAWIVMTWDASSGATQLYVNGSREINATMQSGDLSYITSANAKNQVIELGGEKHAQGTPAFEGSYGEMRFSNTIRYSGASITVPTAALGVDNDTVAYWDFSEAAGTTVYDRSDFDSDASIINGAVSTTWESTGPYG